VNDRLRALLVSYVWPPTGGAGVGRVLKLAKYLPDHDVTPAVLTVANPSVPLIDESLQKDVAPDLEVVRARTLEPGYEVKKAAWASSSPQPVAPSLKGKIVGRAVTLAKSALVPDPQVLWQPDAQRALAARLVAKRDDVVFITAPPFSMFLSTPLVRLRPGTAIVLDYRDEWITLRTSYEMIQGRIAAALGAAMETTLLRMAHAITTATEAFRQNLLDRFKFLDPSCVVTIPNGYDPDDFPGELPEPPRDRFVITYAGTIFKLTSARGLIGAVRRLHQREPELAKLLEVRFLGRIVDTELDAFEGTEALGVKRLGYVDKDRVIPELSASHMALCLLDDVEGVERIYPAKIFELMYLGRPCLTLSPRGALVDLVETHRLGTVLPPRDEEAICALLARELTAFKEGRFSLRAPAVDIDRYHRRAQAGAFAEVFRSAVAHARS
jgi:glycosyltransferase involved in cell wall biosynthesis